MKKDRLSNAVKIDLYIESAPEKQKELLQKIRTTILNSAPEIIEDWKWGPNYNHFGMICGFGYFKHHIKINFFNGAYLSNQHKLFNNGTGNEHNRAIDMVNDTTINWAHLADYVKESCQFNERNNTDQQAIYRPKIQAEIEIPEIISTYFNTYPIEYKYLRSLPRTHQKEYFQWVISAKKESTMQRRLAKMLLQLAQKTKP